MHVQVDLIVCRETMVISTARVLFTHIEAVIKGNLPNQHDYTP